jgi:hypothetical protein
MDLRKSVVGGDAFWSDRGCGRANSDGVETELRFLLVKLANR